MKKTILYLVFAAAACFLHATISFAQVLKADYQFQSDLSSSVPGAPDLTNLVGAGNGPNTFIASTVDGYPRTVLNFPQNNGVAISSLTGVVPNNSFTIVVLFKFGAQSGRRRLVDSSGGTAADEGAFMVGGRVEGEDTSVPGNTVNTYFQIVIVRGNGFFRIYREGNLRLTDTDDGSPLPNGLRWFQDYVNNPIQAAPGAIARMRFYDAPMTAEQIHQLDRIPEAPAGPMPIATFSNLFGQTEMFRMNTDGTSQKRLSNNDATDVAARFSPDGQKIVYHRRETPSGIRQVWIANSDGSNPVQLTNTATNNHNPSWRPDGQKILYSKCDISFICDIATMDPDGSNQAVIPGSINTAVDEDQPRFTPDGSKILFVCISDVGNYNLCTANVDGSNRTQITATGVAIHNLTPDVSPDGTRIMFIRGTNAGNNRTYSANLDGTAVLALPQTQAPATPIWSPDGTKIAYSSTVSNSNEIFISNADGSSPVQITFNSVDDRLSDWYRPPVESNRTPFDYDGDGRTDVSVFRPSTNEWHILQSGGGIRVQGWGVSGDRMAPADFDGDGKTDIAVFRPNEGNWYVVNSSDNTVTVAGWGNSTDQLVPGDYNGDGKADFVIYRPSEGRWYRRDSDGQVHVWDWGLVGDKPAPADFDGDGRLDLTVFRPGEGRWYTIRSSDFVITATDWGVNGDIPVAADYSGDGKADFVVFRPSDLTWYRRHTDDNSLHFITWGLAGDLPAPGDFDGDGKTDLAVYRPSEGTWYVFGSQAGIYSQPFGLQNDLPTPSAFVY